MSTAIALNNQPQNSTFSFEPNQKGRNVIVIDPSYIENEDVKGGGECCDCLTLTLIFCAKVLLAIATTVIATLIASALTTSTAIIQLVTITVGGCCAIVLLVTAIGMCHVCSSQSSRYNQ